MLAKGVEIMKKAKSSCKFCFMPVSIIIILAVCIISQSVWSILVCVSSVHIGFTASEELKKKRR